MTVAKNYDPIGRNSVYDQMGPIRKCGYLLEFSTFQKSSPLAAHVFLCWNRRSGCSTSVVR